MGEEGRVAAYWLVVLSEADGLRWVLENSKMAFSEGMSRRAASMRAGDGLVVYVTRGAFHNPTRDESQLVVLAEVVSHVRPLRQPLAIAGREFVVACDLEFEKVLPERGGVPVRPLVPKLSFIKKKRAWGHYFRSGLLQVPQLDFEVMEAAVKGKAG